MHWSAVRLLSSGGQAARIPCLACCSWLTLRSLTLAPRNVSLCQAKGGPDAPFELQLLTAVQPHKQMAEKMKKPKGHMVAERDLGEEAEGPDQEDVEEAEERKAPLRAAKKGRKGEKVVGTVDEEEVEEDSDGENRDVNLSPDSSRKPAKAGRKAAGAAAGKKGAASAAAAKPMAKRAKA